MKGNWQFFSVLRRWKGDLNWGMMWWHSIKTQEANNPRAPRLGGLYCCISGHLLALEKQSTWTCWNLDSVGSFLCHPCIAVISAHGNKDVARSILPWQDVSVMKMSSSNKTHGVKRILFHRPILTHPGLSRLRCSTTSMLYTWSFQASTIFLRTKLSTIMVSTGFFPLTSRNLISAYLPSSSP